jgi:hypothetical protein
MHLLSAGYGTHSLLVIVHGSHAHHKTSHELKLNNLSLRRICHQGAGFYHPP